MKILTGITLPPIRLIDIEKQVCREFDLNPFVIRLKSRASKHVQARHEFMLRASKQYNQTQIASYLGMHPSTVSDAIKKKNQV